MPVIWHQPAARCWEHAALAVPCSTCGALIGKPCTERHAAGRTQDPHPQRAAKAEAHGFRAIPSAQTLLDLAPEAKRHG